MPPGNFAYFEVDFQVTLNANFMVLQYFAYLLRLWRHMRTCSGVAMPLCRKSKL